MSNKDEVHLILQPEEVLTPLFLEEAIDVAEDKTLVIFFDTYERTDVYLDGWLQDMLTGRFGDVPADVIFVIAGRDELDRNNWLAFEGVTAQIPLEPFNEEEAREYLTHKRITNEQVVETILQLSSRFPLLVATLAAQSPDTLDKIDEASSTSVDRFLKWIADPLQRQAIINASIPRNLNRDVFSLLIDENKGDLFNHLIRMPFVQSKGDGWVYHEVVRTQMLRHKRRESPQEWSELHQRLAAYYASRRDALSLDADNSRRIANAFLEALTHDEVVILFQDELSYYQQPDGALDYWAQGDTQAPVQRAPCENQLTRIGAALNGLNGRVTYRQGHKFGTAAMCQLYRDIRRQYPDQKVYVVQDN